jgi:hypothetical protein
MGNSGSFSPGDFREWSIPAVRLLQGVVYSDEAKTWDILLRSRSSLEGYFARLGLLLIVDEPEGYAFLRQWNDDEWPDGWEPLPKLMRRSSLGYGPTLVAVLLRDELRRFEDEDVHNERCVVEVSDLFEQWKIFFSTQGDEVRQHNALSAALHKLEEIGFVRKFSESPETWEIRRILKARLPVTELDRLKSALASAAARGSSGSNEGKTDE